MKITVAESNHDIGFMAQQLFSCSRDILAVRANKRLVMTMSVTSGQGHVLLKSILFGFQPVPG